MARAFHTLSLLAAVALAAGCTVKDAPAPSLTGPSELSLSLTMAATPDTIAQDGSSQALVVVVARDVSGRAVANLPIRFDVMKGGQIVDYGALSTKTGLTGTDGRAQVVYTAPTPPLNSPIPAASPSTVSVLATPTGANYANAVARTVDIRLVPAGTVYDPGTGPTAKFLVDGIAPVPTSPRKPGVPIVFDATASSSPAGLVSYAWDFGDGSTGAGIAVQHTFTAGGTYYVRLTVTDKKGQMAWVTNTVSVMGGPTAVFTWVQPTLPGPPYEVRFNGSASWPVPPATITAWEWRIDGVVAGNLSTLTWAFPAAGSHTVSLTVTDSNGAANRVTQTISVQ